MAPPFRSQPGPGGGSTKKKFALWALLVASTSAQFSVQDSSSRENGRQQNAIRNSAGRSPAEGALELGTPHAKYRNTYTSNNGDLLSALAPARVDDVVRAPPARDGQSSGLSSLPAARSLQDWEVEDFILVATIDGSLHALDRRNGKERWVLGNPESPMIETTHHRQNQSDDPNGNSEDDFIFIVEPSLDGDLYIQHKDPSIGLQRLDVTVRSLVDRSPQRSRDPPLVFVARKEASMYTIDAATGNVKDFIDTTAVYSSSDTAKGSCRRLSGFEIDEQGCEPAGILHVGRTTHSVVIQDGITRQMICTIKYSEWTPNNGDQDLHGQYDVPFDGRRIHSFHDGQFMGLDISSVDRRTKFHGKLDTPVARVWDVARPIGLLTGESSLVMLSPPADPSNFQSMEWNEDYGRDKVFLNRTEAGWYAMSELRYPGITSQAKKAKIHTVGGLEARYLDFVADSENLIGYHDLSVIGSQGHVPLTISGPLPVSELTVRPEGDGLGVPALTTTPSSRTELMTKYPLGIVLIVAVLIIFTLSRNQKSTNPTFRTLEKTDLQIPMQKPLTEPPNSGATMGVNSGDALHPSESLSPSGRRPWWDQDPQRGQKLRSSHPSQAFERSQRACRTKDPKVSQRTVKVSSARGKRPGVAREGLERARKVASKRWARTLWES